jgi:hypothetical protein
MYAWSLSVCFIFGQIDENSHFRGKVEALSRQTGKIMIRDIESATPAIFTAGPKTRFTKDGSTCKFADLHVSDTVILTWESVRNSLGRNTKWLKTVEILPVIEPRKFKVGQVGYLPLACDNCSYKCDYIQGNMVLVSQTVSATPHQFVAGRRTPARPATNGGKQQFILTDVNPQNYALGQAADIDGKWRVVGTAVMMVTQAGAVVTVRQNTTGTAKVQEKVVATSQKESDRMDTINGIATDTKSNSRDRTNRNSDRDTNYQGTRTTETQHQVSHPVNAFVLTRATGDGKEAR